MPIELPEKFEDFVVNATEERLETRNSRNHLEIEE